jgi:hypothetical protein
MEQTHREARGQRECAGFRVERHAALTRPQRRARGVGFRQRAVERLSEAEARTSLWIIALRNETIGPRQRARRRRCLRNAIIGEPTLETESPLGVAQVTPPPGADVSLLFRCGRASTPWRRSGPTGRRQLVRRSVSDYPFRHADADLDGYSFGDNWAARIPAERRHGRSLTTSGHCRAHQFRWGSTRRCSSFEQVGFHRPSSTQQRSALSRSSRS